ncbi:mannose-6-phosphate isomerase [Candidatus Pacearchaeota archaeon]|jgi:mannose-1-phosphate guanylyltransferase/mannose-1-phosphate guanylyltransferase/mannose-6-phosphate isomerase|nr:mannose-6-phosphate isomerase [Candidatus Pacearchaeota archaeon]|tara:strand:- start:160 stop:516 length:357 start_codon:yes stop_codon:yes gene_type:complete
MKKKSDKRPWGGFEQFTLNEESTVKILTIKPHQSPSVQKHKHRSEFWVILDNPIKVTLGNRTFRAVKDQEIFIKKGQVHTAEAYSKTARILEISFGKFDENDITRLKDKYGRVNDKKK